MNGIEFSMKNFIKKLTGSEKACLNKAEKEFVIRILEDNEEYEKILDLLDERPYRKRYLKERRAESKSLLYPDADEIYMRYYNQKDLIEDLKSKCLMKDAIINDLHKKIMELDTET